MSKNNPRDFIGDEKWDEMQEQLLETKIQTQKHIAVNEQSKANLELFEEITANSAIQLAEKQSFLSDLTQKLTEAQTELNRQNKLMQQQEALNESKAYVLRTAQKELEDCQIKYCQTLETIKKIGEQIDEYENSIEKASIQVKSAYNNWQHNYNLLQEQKSAAEKNDIALQQLKAKINNITQKQEMSKNQAADMVAESVIESLEQNLGITNFHITDLPKATLQTGPVIPEIPPIDDELALLIKEATSDDESEYRSLRHETAPVSDSLNTTEDSESSEPNIDDGEDFWREQDKHSLSKNHIFAEPPKENLKTAEENKGADTGTDTVKSGFTAPALPENEELAKEINKYLEDTSDKDGNKAESVSQSNGNDDINQAETAKKKSSLKGYILCVAIVLIVTVALRMFVFQITEISGDSMSPTLNSGERVISSAISYYFEDVEVGDIIIFQAPDRSDKAYYVKRVVAMPGDHVLIDEGVVRVNNAVIEENYLQDSYTEGYVDTIVPENEYFVLGDNRPVSHDSRNPDVSTISEESILGKAVFRIYPFPEIGMVE